MPNDDWKCPKCGAGPDAFAIWDPLVASCEGEHEADVAECTDCGYSATLKTVTNNYWKAKGIEYVKCPHCNGTGQVVKC